MNTISNRSLITPDQLISRLGNKDILSWTTGSMLPKTLWLSCTSAVKANATVSHLRVVLSLKSLRISQGLSSLSSTDSMVNPSHSDKTIHPTPWRTFNICLLSKLSMISLGSLTLWNRLTLTVSQLTCLGSQLVDLIQVHSLLGSDLSSLT